MVWGPAFAYLCRSLGCACIYHSWKARGLSLSRKDRKTGLIIEDAICIRGRGAFHISHIDTCYPLATLLLIPKLCACVLCELCGVCIMKLVNALLVAAYGTRCYGAALKQECRKTKVAIL